jgi:hypothetical protein
VRVSEAASADVDALGIERGHRTLVITRKAAKSAQSRSPRARDRLAVGSAAKDPCSCLPTGAG